MLYYSGMTRRIGGKKQFITVQSGVEAFHEFRNISFYRSLLSASVLAVAEKDQIRSRVRIELQAEKVPDSFPRLRKRLAMSTSATNTELCSLSLG